MNIFAFDTDPWLAALWLDDVRKNKMILETAQLLSSSVAINDPSLANTVYKPTHLGHPCCRWVCLSKANFRWLTDYMQCLVDQKGKHLSSYLIPVFNDYYHKGWFATSQPTTFANCAANAGLGISFKHIEDVTLAYRLYINERWKQDTIVLSWIHGEKPSWKE